MKLSTLVKRFWKNHWDEVLVILGIVVAVGLVIYAQSIS